MNLNTKYLDQLLYQILESKERKRSLLIKKFQNYVWNDEVLGMNPVEEDIYITLAYDLDFYEPDSILQSEEPSYYDEERLIVEIRDVLNKLKLLTIE